MYLIFSMMRSFIPVSILSLKKVSAGQVSGRRCAPSGASAQSWALSDDPKVVMSVQSLRCLTSPTIVHAGHEDQTAMVSPLSVA